MNKSNNKRSNTKRSNNKRSNTKRSIVVEPGFSKQKRKYVSHKSDDNLQMEYSKEKEILKQWKTDRKTQKKHRSIRRGKVRDACMMEKQQFTEVIKEDYEDIHLVIWKHPGCNAACKGDECQQYQLEYLWSYFKFSKNKSI